MMVSAPSTDKKYVGGPDVWSHSRAREGLGVYWACVGRFGGAEGVAEAPEQLRG
jgi:hypothetical protein